MAISITQQPSYPNAAYTNLLYAVTSNRNTNFQFQYVMDIKQNGELLTRIRQYPNPAGSAIFNPADIFNDYCEYETDKLVISNTTSAGTSIQDFTVAFGEEFATSISGSVAIYDGVLNSIEPGAPARTANTATVFPAIIDPNNGVSYNFQDVYPSTGWFMTANQQIKVNPATNANATCKTAALTDKGVLGVYSPGQAPSSISARLYTKDHSLIRSISLATPSVPDVYFWIPTGPANIGFNASDWANAHYYEIEGSAMDSIYIYKDECEHLYERTNFAFINRFGTWDSFGVSLPRKKNTNMKRLSVNRSQADYSSTTSTYSRLRGGETVYNQTVNDTFEVSTGWLDQQSAAWLADLLESPRVFVQESGTFIPVVIENKSYRHNTNPRAQKAFEYTIQFKHATQRIAR